jgi:DNA repair exonuclease SbcCD ATPase subunit
LLFPKCNLCRYGTGKAIPERVISEKMSQEDKKESELERARLKNIHLRYQLRRLEQTLKAKEELSEGLHLIDFEQLKIENQSLNEKIEERNEELLKLRKKTTTTVQVLTHLKEKLQFVQKENEILGAGMESLEYGLTSKREHLQSLKLERDKLRLENGRMKGQSATVTNPILLDDMDAHKDRAAELKQHLSALQSAHASVTRKTLGQFKMAAPPVAAAGAAPEVAQPQGVLSL